MPGGPKGGTQPATVASTPRAQAGRQARWKMPRAGYLGGKVHPDGAQTSQEEEEQILKSLRLPGDPRFAEMKNYTESSAGQEHFARLLSRRTAKLGDDISQQVEKGAARFDHLELTDDRNRPAQLGGLQERSDWQQAFDKSVKRLLIDFDLSPVPSYRLNHLDRMHTWFTQHGGKQQRKAKEGPSYLVADRSGVMPPGSTSHLSSKRYVSPRGIDSILPSPSSSRPGTRGR